MSEMILKGEIPNGAKVIIEPNDTSYEEIAEGETIVNIKVTQPKLYEGRGTRSGPFSARILSSIPYN
jgi:hypothetical protein